MPSLTMRTVNLSLLAILVVSGLSGIGTFLFGSHSGAWMFWLHRIASFALLPLLVWKAGIVFRSYRKRGLTISTFLSAISAVLFVATFAYGLLWATVGVGGSSLPLLGSATGLGVHVALAFIFLPFILNHVVSRWSLVRLRRPDFASRRAAIRYLALGGFGLLFWRSAESVTAAAEWSGAERRFTGSRLRGQFSGNDYPVVNWLSDPVPSLSEEKWQLRIYGLVEREVAFGLDDLINRFEYETWGEILDCTGGWYSEQRWTGVPVRALIGETPIRESARSVVFYSETGYRRRFDLEQVDSLLLAFQIEDEDLSRGHGYPVRLVAPGHRGYDWVKWVVGIEISGLPAWFESPLPLQ